MELYGYHFIRESEDELSHYGLKGMKWGTRHWQNYDATNTFNAAGIQRYFGRTPGKDSQAVKEPKVYHKPSSIKPAGSARSSQNESQGPSVSKQELKEATRATKLLAMSPEDSEKLAKIAKVAGISLATTAGVMAVGYIAYKYGPDMRSLISDPKAYAGFLQNGYNADAHATRALGLTEKLFNNQYNDDAIGAIAKSRGLGFVSADQIANSIKNPVARSMAEDDLGNLVKDITVNLRTGASSRRLSCWPGSNAYFMSMMTGQDYASRSFTNLVDFHDFGQLYTKAPKIFNANGKVLSDFVGRWGKGYARANVNTTKSLVQNIFKNISAADNLTPDGSRTIGFINAAYGGTTCTHQWNFDIVHKANGVKELIMSDTWDGSRYAVASLSSSGKINYATEFAHLVEEMGHYNARSIRFYAPKVETVNPSMMANVILGKTGNAAAQAASSSVTSNAARSARSFISGFESASVSSVFNSISKDDVAAKVNALLEQVLGKDWYL